MTDGTLVTLISLGVTFLFMLGVPVLLVIGYWVIGCSFVLGLTLDNMGAELLNVFNKGFALLAMPLFILTGDLINKSGIARRLSDFAYACLGWIRGGLAMASLGACGLFAAISGSNSATTLEYPSTEVEVSSLMSLIVERSSSMMRVIWLSTSAGDTPG